MSLNLDKRQRAMLQEMGVQVWLPEAPAAEPPAAAQALATHADGAKAAGHFENAKAAGQASGRRHDEAPARLPDRPPLQRETPPQPLPRQPAGSSVSQPAGTSVTRLASSSVSQPAGSSASQPTGPSAVFGSSSSSGFSSVRAETQGGSSAAWLLGAAQPLYAHSAETTQSADAAHRAEAAHSAETAQSGSGARWLVLAETPPTALPGGALSAFAAFDGEAGQLLGNMLRAARLDRAALALLAPLVRQGAGAVTPEFSAALAALVAQAQPDIVLIMGRLASQSLLPGGLFGKLRGQVHTLHGARAIVTYDAPYLLRKPEDKAKAWADLCLAMSLSAAP